MKCGLRRIDTQDIIDGLKWLGLNWDEGPDIGGLVCAVQTNSKIDHYTEVANKLINRGFAYFPYETPEELAALKEAQKDSDTAHRYDNSHRSLSKEQVEKVRR